MGMSLSILRPSSSGLTSRLPLRTAVLVGVPLAFGVAGLSYYAWRRYSDIDESSVVSESTPQSKAVALKNKGNKYFKGVMYEQAIKLYSEALEICPDASKQDRAILYQNRAAAKENLKQYESALSDCDSSLALTPTYLKALNRRANLYERLERFNDALMDITACCMLEKFGNTPTLITMDRLLKQISQEKANEERTEGEPSLPSAGFIQTYFSAFAWDPFTLPSRSTIDHFSSSIKPSQLPISHDLSGSATPGNGYGWSSLLASICREPSQSTTYDDLAEALAQLDVTLAKFIELDFSDETAKLLSSTLAKFEVALTHLLSSAKPDSTEPSIPSKPPAPINTPDTLDDNNNGSSDHLAPVANGDSISNLDLNGDQSDLNDESLASTSSSATIASLGRAAYCQAALLHATFLLLTNCVNDAKKWFSLVEADDSGASVRIKVNSLIKTATMAMSVDQDFAACLYKFQIAQSVCPDCPDVYLHRGQIHLTNGQLDEALSDFNIAVKLKPEFSVAQCQRLFTLYRRAVENSDRTEARSRVDELRRLVQKYPTCVESRSLLAQALSEIDKFEEAYEQFTKSIEIQPNSGILHAHLGLTLLRWKADRDAAIDWLHKGAKVDPKCELIFELLGQLSVERGDLEEAHKYFDQAVKLARFNTSSLAHLIALREGVATQLAVAARYNISIKDFLAEVRANRQGMMG